MILNTNYKLLENPSEGNTIFGYQFDKIFDGIVYRYDLIKIDLLREMQSFITRNTIVKVDNSTSRHRVCCKRCLKAHLVMSLRKVGLDNESVRNIADKIKGSVGHNGYYTDGEDLIKICL